MKGFTDKALLLFPKMESFDQRGCNYKASFKLALQNMLYYLEQRNISPYVLYTDDVGRYLFQEPISYISTLGKADMYFVSKNCEGMSNALRLPMTTYEAFYDTALRKRSTAKTATVEDRFGDVMYRANLASLSIIKQYKLVIHFIRRGNPNYKVKSKPNDKRILLEVNAITFLPTTYMSGREADPCGILNVPYGNRSLLVWGDV